MLNLFQHLPMTGSRGFRIKSGMTNRNGLSPWNATSCHPERSRVI